MNMIETIINFYKWVIFEGGIPATLIVFALTYMILSKIFKSIYSFFGDLAVCFLNGWNRAFEENNSKDK